MLFVFTVKLTIFVDSVTLMVDAVFIVKILLDCFLNIVFIYIP